MNTQKILLSFLTVCTLVLVTACSEGPEILFIKVDFGGGGQSNDDESFRNYSFQVNQSRRIGDYYRQSYSGFGGLAIACGPLAPASYTTIVNRSRTESVSFNIKKEVLGNAEGNGGPMHRASIDYITYKLEPLQSLTMNQINSCYYMLNKPFGVRSKFQYSIKSATPMPFGSPAFIQNLKAREKSFMVAKDSSCQAYCKDNWCLSMPFDTHGQQQAVNIALNDFNALLVGSSVNVIDIQKALHIDKTDCSISDLIAVERGFEVSGNQCSFQTKGSELVDVTGHFPDLFKFGVTSEPNKKTYTFSPTIPLVFEGASEEITNALNTKFAAGLSSIEVAPNKIFVGSGPECMVVNIK